MIFRPPTCERKWERSNLTKLALKFHFLKDQKVGLPKDLTQNFKMCSLYWNKFCFFNVMYRVSFQGAKVCEFFDIDISMKLRVNLKNCKKTGVLSIVENSLWNCVILSPCLDELITGQDHEQSECETIYSSNLSSRKSGFRWRLKWSKYWTAVSRLHVKYSYYSNQNHEIISRGLRIKWRKVSRFWNSGNSKTKKTSESQNTKKSTSTWLNAWTSWAENKSFETHLLA